MHICFITNEFPKKNFTHGGVGTFVQTFAKKLIELGHQVSVIGINYEAKFEMETQNGISIYRLKPNKIKGVTWLLNFWYINKKIKEIHSQKPIDIVETTEAGLAFLQRLPDIKYIIRLHGGHHFFAEAENRSINKWKAFQEKKSFSKADAFIGVSLFVKNHTEKYLSFQNKSIEIISNPIEMDKFYRSDGSKENKFTIVFAGTVCEKKGIRQLTQSLDYLVEKFPDLKLEVYGRDWLFPNKTSYIEYLKNQTSPDILRKINFHGAVSHDLLPEIYEKATVCVFPSHMETQGLVAPEAMAMEKPVIFTALGPGPEIIDHLQNGLLCNPLDPKDIASKIEWVFSHKNEAQELGINARKKVLENFNLDKITHANLDFYKKIIKARN